jgi:UPF0755 protein
MSETTTPGARRRGAGRVIAYVVLVVMLAGAGVVGAAYVLNQPPARELAGPVEFSIERGESLTSIANRLENLGIIRSGFMLRLIAQAQGTATSVQSGNYLFSERMSARSMHDYLLSGNQVLRRVTIPEGLTVRGVAERLGDAGITTVDAFEDAARDEALLAEFSIPGESAEGYLFPDTYLFTQDYPAESVARHMIERFFAVLGEIYPEYGDLPSDVLYDRVILASIVEREYRVPEEAPTIASVFYNRLDINMRLESCATVVYVMTEIEGLQHPQRLFYRDLDRASPYNTYRTTGLPPGPIASPGRTALHAVFFPDNTDYRFFVWNGPGSSRHAFSRTLSEHNEARLLYLKSP